VCVCVVYGRCVDVCVCVCVCVCSLHHTHTVTYVYIYIHTHTSCLQDEVQRLQGELTLLTVENDSLRRALEEKVSVRG